MLVALAAAPPTWTGIALAVGLFRLFDITKPFPARRAERLPAGWGVLADDVAAGVWAAAIVLVLTRIVPIAAKLTVAAAGRRRASSAPSAMRPTSGGRPSRSRGASRGHLGALSRDRTVSPAFKPFFCSRRRRPPAESESRGDDSRWSPRPTPTKTVVSLPSRSSCLMCAALTSQLRWTRANERPSDDSIAESERSTSNVPCAVCTDVRRSAASKAQTSEGSRNTRPRPRRATMRSGPGAGASLVGAARVQALEARLNALLGERLQEVVGDAELERLERVLLERGREDEQRRVRACASSRTSSSPAPSPSGTRWMSTKTTSTRRCRVAASTARASSMRRDRAHDLGDARALEQLDEVVARGPLVLEDERAELRDSEPFFFTKAPSRVRHGGTAARRSSACLLSDDSIRRTRVGKLELEAAPHGPEPERAGARLRVGKPGTVVLDRADDLLRVASVARGRRADGHDAASAATQRAVLDRVLDERLEEQSRDEGALRHRLRSPSGS